MSDRFHDHNFDNQLFINTYIVFIRPIVLEKQDYSAKKALTMFNHVVDNQG